jgi:hypothetical protein
MGSGKGRPRSHRPSPRLTLRRFAWALVATALVVGVPAALSGGGSTLLWLDFGLCIALASLLFLVASHERRGAGPAPAGRGDPYRWRDTALVVSALVTILSPVVKLAVDVAARPLRTITVKERSCPRPRPPGEGDPY